LPKSSDGLSRISWLNARRTYVLIALLWSGMTLWNFGLPGLQLDEINHYAFIPGIKSESAARLSHYRLPDNYLDESDGVRRFPIVGGSVYNSPVTAYLGLPYFMVSGHSQEAVRIFSAFLALISILALARVTGKLFGWPAALLAGAIIATDPTHVFATRSQGISIWPVLLFWALAANLMLRITQEGSSPAWRSALCGALLGWTAMAYFIGFFLAVPTALFCLFLLRDRPRHLVAFVAAGLLAYAPMLYALASIQAISPQLLDNFGMPSWAERGSIGLLSLDNLGRLGSLLFGAFGSFEFARGVTGHFSAPQAPLRLTLFSISILMIVGVILRRSGASTSQRASLGIFAGLGVLYLAGIFALKATSVHHLIPLTILAAVACASLVALGRFTRFAAASIGTVLLITNLMAGQKAHTALTETGGYRFHNEGHSLVALMLAGPLSEYHPVFTAWGFHLQFLFLTDGQRPYSVISGADRQRIDELLQRHGKISLIVKIDELDRVRAAFEIQHEILFTQRNGPELFAMVLVTAADQGIVQAAASD